MSRSRDRLPLAPLYPLLVAVFAQAVASCGSDRDPDPQPPPVDLAAQAAAVEEVVHAERLLGHLEALGSDPARTYVLAELQRLGLEPGGVDGSFEQRVVERPSVIEATPWAFRRGGRELILHSGSDFVAAPGLGWSTTRLMEAPLAFAGSGEVAAGGTLALSGRLLLVALAPPASSDPGAREALLANSRGVLESASRHGARGVLFFATSELGVSPGEAAEAARDTGVEVAGWLSEPAARSLLAMVASASPAHLWTLGAGPGFAPLALDARASLELRHSVREVVGRNVLALRRGRDPGDPDETVLFFAALPAQEEPRAGSVDGGGVYSAVPPRVAAAAAAQLLTVAAGFQMLSDPPRRSVLFAFTASGSDGTLGLRKLLESIPGGASIVAAVELAGQGPRAGSQRVGAVAHDGSPVAADVERAARSLGWRVLSAPLPPGAPLSTSHLGVLAEATVPAVSLTSAPVESRPVAPDPDGRRAGRESAPGASRGDAAPATAMSLEELVLGARLAFRIGLELAELDETPAPTSLERVATSLRRSIAAPDEDLREPGRQMATGRAAEPPRRGVEPTTSVSPPRAAPPWVPPPPVEIPPPPAEPPPTDPPPPPEPEPESEPPPSAAPEPAEEPPPDDRPPDLERRPAR